MLRTALVVCALISLSVCQIGGTTGPCSAYPVPGNFYDPLSLFGSTTASQVFTSPCSVASYSGFTWYAITPEAGATVNITTCSSYTNFDTVLSLYTGDCSSLSCLEFDDDSCGRASNLSFAADGQTYYVSVSGYSTASGSFELTFSASQPAVIDLGCNGSIAIPGPYFTPVTILGNNEGKQGSDANTCGVSASSKIDWYTITPSNGTRVEISTCSSTTNFDTRLAIFTGTCGGLNCFTYNDDNCTIFSLASGLSFISSSSYYYLAVFGYGAAAGTYTVRISESYAANSTATNCTAAIALPFVPGQLLAINSTTHASNVSLVSACGKPHPAPSSWYKIEVPSDYKHPITASTCRHGTMFDTMLYVYSGSCDQLICTGHNDDGCQNGSVVTWNVPNPTDLHAEVVPLTFYIQVAGFAVSAGNFELSIQ